MGNFYEISFTSNLIVADHCRWWRSVMLAIATSFHFAETKYWKLDNVAINDVLPLKAARRDAIANLKCFWGLGHQRPNFDGYIYIHCAAPPYSARISAT